MHMGAENISVIAVYVTIEPVLIFKMCSGALDDSVSLKLNLMNASTPPQPLGYQDIHVPRS